jgi:hypothetical protein
MLRAPLLCQLSEGLLIEKSLYPVLGAEECGMIFRT